MATVNQPSKNRNFILIGVLLLLLGVGATQQFLAPNLKESKAELETAKAKQKGLQTDVQILTTAQSQLQTAENAMKSERGVDFAKVPLVFPKNEDIPGLYLQLEALMSQALSVGLKLPSYQVSSPVVNVAGAGVEIPVTISAVGTYPVIQGFIGRLEQNLRPLSIQTVNLAQTLDKDKGTANGQFTLNVVGVVRAEALSAAYGGK